MVLFNIINKEAHPWENLRERFLEDLKDMEEKARQIEADIYAGNFASPDIDVRKKAEENLASALAMAIYEKEMIVKTAVHNLSNVHEKINEEIDLINKKIRYFNDFVFENAQKAAEMAWEAFSVEKQAIEQEIAEADKKTNQELMKETDENKKREIFMQNEQFKAEKFAELNAIRTEQINSYINSLIHSGIQKIEEKIKEAINAKNNTETKETEYSKNTANNTSA
jgi:hypothetical protein